MPRSPEENPLDGLRNAVGIVVFVAKAFASSVEVLLHRPGTLGERYFSGFQTGVAVLLIVFWPALCQPKYDFSWVYFYLGLYIMFCFGHRGRIAQRLKRGGPEPHSRYTGTPWLARLLPRMEEARIKSFVEPMFTFVTGAVVVGVLSPPLGGFLMVASLGLLISNNVGGARDRQRALDMHDAHLEQRSLMDRFRNNRGNR